MTVLSSLRGHQGCRALLLVVAVLTACGPSIDAVTTPGAPSDPQAIGASEGYGQAESRLGIRIPEAVASRALERVARALALSLAIPEQRAALRFELVNSRYKEHKISVTTLLSGSPSDLVRRVSLAASRPGSWLQGALDSTVDLELYMPVRGQLENWSGDGAIMVAFQLNAADPVRAFGIDGRLVELSSTTPPTSPTLVLVPTETNFSVVPTREALAEADCETHPELCDGGGDGGGGESAIRYPHLFATNIHLDDLHEGWMRGSPEIEIHLIGPDSSGTFVRTYACAGEHQSGVKHFDMDDHDFTGTVEVAGHSDMNAPILGSDSSLAIGIWEDDDSTCIVKDHGDLAWTVQAIGLTFIGYASAALVNRGNHRCTNLAPCDLLNYFQWYASIGIAIYTTVIWLQYAFDGILNQLLATNDDLVGVLMPSARWNAAHGDSVTSTHVVVKEDVRVGTLDLVTVGLTN